MIDAGHADPRPVLVVEDCDDDFDTVLVSAKRARVCNPLIRAEDAELAWYELTRTASGLFAFVLLDYNLTGQDGLALLARLRSDDMLADLPVVVLTSSVNPRDRDAFFAAGASAFHVKSVQHSVCLRTLESIFGQWLNQAAPLHRAATAPSMRRRA